MSRNKQGGNYAQNTFISAGGLTQYHRGDRENIAEHRKLLEERLQETEFKQPSGRLVLSQGLGYPDFEPATHKAKEEDLSNERIRNGYVLHHRNPLSEATASHHALDRQVRRHCVRIA
jgi:hypothetical protein